MIAARATPPIGTPSLSDSQQFVMPREAAAPQAMAGHSMVSVAVAAAVPAAPRPPRTPAGGQPPRPLSELATEGLIRPDDGADSFELAASGALILRVTDRVLTRLDGVHVTGGELVYEVATRRSRGQQTDERFDHGASPLHLVSGKGYAIAVPLPDTAFVAVALDDDILYLREDLVFAFDASLRWENGNVPGLRGQLPVVQFRGDGALVLRVARPLVRVKLPAQGLLYVDAARLAGWIGRVIPRAVVPPSGGPLGATCIECTGEGIVLLEPPAEARPFAVPAGAPERATPPPPPAAAADREPSHAGDDDDDTASDGVTGGPPEAKASDIPELADLGSAADEALGGIDEI